MPNNDTNKIGEIADSFRTGNPSMEKNQAAEHSRNLPEGRWWIVPLTPAEQEYWRSRNPLLGYRHSDLKGKANRVAAVIEHVSTLIQHRIDRGERYFTEYSNHADLLELRQDIVAHFKRLGIRLTIRRGGYIFVITGGVNSEN